MEKLVWQCAGQLGLDPGGLTLRQLLQMAEYRNRQLWDHTSQVLCFMANAWCRGKGKPAFMPAEFHPYEQQAREPIRLSPKKTMELLHAIYEPGSKSPGSGASPGDECAAPLVVPASEAER